MSLRTILIIILILVLLGVIPTWGHSRGWGYGPSGIIGLILIIVLILALLGRLSPHSTSETAHLDARCLVSPAEV